MQVLISKNIVRYKEGSCKSAYATSKYKLDLDKSLQIKHIEGSWFIDKQIQNPRLYLRGEYKLKSVMLKGDYIGDPFSV